MKDIKDDEIQFVANHYKENKLNTDDAWKKFNKGKHRTRIISIRHIAVAAMAVFAICIVAAIVVSNLNTNISVISKGTVTKVAADTISVSKQDSTKIFRYNREPIANVMSDLSAYYGCRFIVNDSTKRVSGEFEVGSAKEAANVIERALDVKIRIE